MVSAAAAIAAAQGVPHNMVSRHTMVNTNLIGAVVGDGLTLTNGTISAAGGLSSNEVSRIVADATDGMVKTSDLNNYTGDIVTGGRVSAGTIDVQGNPLGTAAYRNANEFATATNLPALPPSATVGEIVDKLNAVIGALHE